MNQIPAPVRRQVAIREGIQPGGRTSIACHWCNSTAVATWPLRRDGRPTYWPMLGGFALDHLVPQARGGRHEADNLVISCGPCNSSKRDRAVPVWLARDSGNVPEPLASTPWNESSLIPGGIGREGIGREGKGSATARRLWLVRGSQIQTVRSVTRETPTLGLGT